MHAPARGPRLRFLPLALSVLALTGLPPMTFSDAAPGLFPVSLSAQAPPAHAGHLRAQGVPAPSAYFPDQAVLSHREQAGIVRGWIEKRFDTLLPELMRREGIDMWIIISREYNDDPVFRSMAPLETYSSRRRTILVFNDLGPERGVERLSVGRFNYDGLFQAVPTHNEEQFEGLLELVRERNPGTIGVNMSGRWNHADGLTATQRDTLFSTLSDYQDRIRSAEMLAVGWLEVKLPEETELYRHVVRVAHSIIGQALSNEVIVPGVTTADDVRWWMRQKAADMGLAMWFHPSFSIQREGVTGSLGGDAVIQRGDLLWMDMGIVYLGLSTDTQHNAYVLRHGETNAPEGLKAGLRAAQRLQDITMEEARVGRTGNQALAASLERARSEGSGPRSTGTPWGTMVTAPVCPWG
jgi:hypothetical protein